MTKEKIKNNLSRIQQELKVPKNQYNSFGKYKYRNCEDILEGVKPLLNEECDLYFDENIEMIGDRFYVKATAIFEDKNKTYKVSSFARESLDKKGMDSAQITGAASSYARKYALNGLFLIDDTKDDLDANTDISTEYLKEIEAIKTLDELKKYYENNKGKGKDFINAITTKKAKLTQQNNENS